MSSATLSIEMPELMQSLFMPSRYKIYYGGRGGGKSHSVARALIVLSLQKTLRIACCREVQDSIKDSVKKLLADIINEYELNNLFYITVDGIRCIPTGSTFSFLGLRYDPTKIKSMEGVDICWVEEAESVSRDSWDILKPTIRKPDSEIWVTFNPVDDEAPAYTDFVLNPPKNAIVTKINYFDNPFISQTLLDEMEYCRERSYEDYLHIWEGEPRQITEAQIFKGCYEVKDFEIPSDARWLLGLDWGFANDPTALTASFIKDSCLYIAYEAGAVELSFEEIARLLDSIPDDLCRKWSIKADCARPESIHDIRARGFNIKGAAKWKGSVEDGITYLKSFKKIYIHPSCTQTATEFKYYNYKVDRVTEEVLPIVVDKFNHYIDSIRYALDGYITRKNMNISKAVTEALTR